MIVPLRLLGITAVAATLLATSACGNSDPLSSDGGECSADLNTVAVGSADFPESEIIAEIYAEALRANGFDVTAKPGIGSREAYIPALQDCSIDLIPEYTGNLLLYFDTDATAASPDDVNAALAPKLTEQKLAVATPSAAEDKDAVVVTRETATEWNLTSIGDLASRSAEVTFGAPAEFQTRAYGLPGLLENYGVDIAPDNFVPITGGVPATVAALTDGKVVAADIFTTTPAIVRNDLVVLTDPANNFPAQNVVPLLRADKRSDKLIAVLDAVSAKLTTADLLELNDAVAGDGGQQEPDEAATTWVSANGFDKPIG